MIKSIKKLARFAVADGGSLTARVVRSGLWVSMTEVLLQLINFVRSIVLARLLVPEMFGLMGLAMIVVRGIETFTRPGVAQALIARQQSFEAESATAFTLLVGRGILLALLLAATAPFISAFYEADRLEAILFVLSVVFVIQGFANINLVARQRELDFRRITHLTQATNVIGTIVTIALAFLTRDVWALVIGQVVSVSLHAILSYAIIGGRMRFAFDRRIAGELLSYGKFITGSSIVMFIATELDTAVIGKVLDTEQLGYYTMAFLIANLVTANLSKVAAGIMMPAYSKLQNDPTALRRAYLRTFSLVMFVVLPAATGLVVVAEPLVVVIYGENWLPAAAPLQVLAVFGLFRALAAFSGYLFEGIGMPGIAFRLALVRLIVIVPLIIPALARFGLVGAAGTVALGMGVQWLFGLYYLRARVGVSLADLGAAIGRPVWTAAAMGAVVALTGTAIAGNTVAGLAAMVFCGIAVYIVLNFKRLLEIKTMIGGSVT